MAIKACEIVGLNKKKLINLFNKLKSVKGRLELVREFSQTKQKFLLISHIPLMLLRLQ